MGISRMQGTSAFIEYVGEKKVKKNSCKNCKNYFDGVCKTRKIVIEYGDNSGKLCKEFDPVNVTKARKNKGNIKEQSKENITLKTDNNSNNITDSVRRITIENNEKVAWGCTILIQEVQLSRERFEIEITKGKVDEMFVKSVYNQREGYKFRYEGILYKIIDIRKTKK